MVRVSVGLHVASAAALAVGARLGEQPLGYAFAALFLLSTFFRPAVEYYRYVRRQLGTALVEVRYPRDDVMKVVQDVESLVHTQGDHHEQLVRLRHDHARLQAEVQQRSDDAQRKLDAVARRFEETIDRLTDNQEIISGIKAFLRLVQRPGPLPPGA
jgi:ABC-type transporter Mla subunit MlaD